MYKILPWKSDQIKNQLFSLTLQALVKRDVNNLLLRMWNPMDQSGTLLKKRIYLLLSRITRQSWSLACLYFFLSHVMLWAKVITFAFHFSFNSTKLYLFAAEQVLWNFESFYFKVTLFKVCMSLKSVPTSVSCTSWSHTDILGQQDTGQYLISFNFVVGTWGKKVDEC